MNKKLLTGAMAAISAAGMVPTTALAGTNVDAIYKAAYEATVKALEVKTQDAINEAREAIAKLPTELEWAVGEFSKQVDTVQHPILVNIVNAIEAAQKDPVQAKINAAKKAIPANLPAVWRASYSSAVDVIQQELQARLVSAVETAETLKTAEAVAAARLLVNDVLTADDANMKAWAQIMSDKLDAVVVSPIVVTAVKELTTQSITVEFKALEEAVKGATVTVVDGNGKIYAVQAKDLVKGETTATFKFVETLLQVPTSGVWSINGYRLNLDEKAYVAELNRLVDMYYGFNADLDYVQKSVLAHLKSASLENINDKNIVKYIETLSQGGYGSVADVQDIIDTVNQEVLTGLTMAQIVKDAHKGTVAQFTETLRKAGFARVNIGNVEWVESYKNAIVANFLYTQFPTNASHIQVVLDDVNAVKVNEAYNEIASTHKERRTAKIAEVLALANTYLADGDAKKAQIKAINIADAVQQVNMAATKAELKAGLQALKAIDNSVINYDERVNESIMETYLNEKLSRHALDITVENSNVISDIINNGERSAIYVALGNVEATASKVLAPPSHPTVANEAETRKADFLAALEKLATVSAKSEKNSKYPDVKFDFSAVKEARYVEYAQEVTDGSLALANDVNTAVAIVNVRIVNTVISGSFGSDKELLSALKSDKLQLTNVVDANKTAYYNDNELIRATSEFAYRTEVEAINALTKVVNDINYKQQIVAGENAATVLAGLKNIASANSDNFKTFIALGTTAQQDIAELIFSLSKDEKADKLVEDMSTLVSEQVKEQQKTLDLLNATYDVKDEVQLENLISNMNRIPQFKALSDVEKVKAAAAFIENRPYKTDAAGNVTTDPVTLKNFTEVMSYTK